MRFLGIGSWKTYSFGDAFAEDPTKKQTTKTTTLAEKQRQKAADRVAAAELVAAQVEGARAASAGIKFVVDFDFISGEERKRRTSLPTAAQRRRTIRSLLETGTSK
ncbi:MAG: hypothetical protein MHM6MM_007850 [Cercozoa sp. M6MM]